MMKLFIIFTLLTLIISCSGSEDNSSEDDVLLSGDKFLFENGTYKAQYSLCSESSKSAGPSSVVFSGNNYTMTVPYFSGTDCTVAQYTLVSVGTYEATNEGIAWTQKTLHLTTEPGQATTLASSCFGVTLVDSVPVDVAGKSCAAKVLNANDTTHVSSSSASSNTFSLYNYDVIYIGTSGAGSGFTITYQKQ